MQNGGAAGSLLMDWDSVGQLSEMRGCACPCPTGGFGGTALLEGSPSAADGADGAMLMLAVHEVSLLAGLAVAAVGLEGA